MCETKGNMIPLSILTARRLSVCINAENYEQLTGKHNFQICYIDNIECSRTLQKYTTLQDAFNTMVNIVAIEGISFCELYINEPELSELQLKKDMVHETE